VAAAQASAVGQSRQARPQRIRAARCSPRLTRVRAHAGAFGNPAHLPLDAPTLLGGYYAPVPNVATAFPPDHPLWKARVRATASSVRGRLTCFSVRV